MILFKHGAEMAGWARQKRVAGRQIGFVPTMGALHSGHLSLIASSKNALPVTVCSIFVNPTQFNDPKDFSKYPITIEHDICLLEKAGVDALFLPKVEEMYPEGVLNLEKYALGRLEKEQVHLGVADSRSTSEQSERDGEQNTRGSLIHESAHLHRGSRSRNSGNLNQSSFAV